MLRPLPAFVVSCLVAVCVPGLLGQTTAYSGGTHARALVTGPIDEARLTVLAGNTHPQARAKNDRGAVDESFRLDHLQLLLKRPPELEKQLDALMQQQQENGSPHYHKWLTAGQFGARYGVAQADVAKVESWLSAHGFRVESVAASGMYIDFSGTAGQVKQAFHTEIHHLEVGGERHIANMSDPKIPAALAGVVKGVVSLNDFMPHPMYKKRAKYTWGENFYIVAPADLATIYNLNPAFNAGYTGSGQQVVVIEDSDVYSTDDVSTFRSTFGLSGYSGTFTQTNPAGSNTCTDPGAVNGSEGEATLDAEWAGASAPGAAVVVASCSDSSTTFGGLLALENLLEGTTLPQIVSISYGECEVNNGQTQNAAFYSTYQQAAAEGVSVFVSAGDEGAASCDPHQIYASDGISVSGFASTPYNVAVGGTDFADTYQGTNGTYWSSANSSADGSALSYIPEIPWNNSCASQLLATYNGYATTYGEDGFCNSGIGQDYLMATSGSGGPSSCYSLDSNNNCLGQPKPTWQTALGNPTDSVRDLPDVSLFAANGVAWNHNYVYCDSDYEDGETACQGTPDTWSGGGGTSFAAPILAGVQALLNQASGGTAWGNPNPRLYTLGSLEFGNQGSSSCNSSLGNAVANTCVFYDVTLGDMDLPCIGTDNCYLPSGSFGVLSTSNAAYSPAYGTQTGWDFATGLGTINVYNLIRDWAGVQSTTVVTTSAAPASTGQAVTYTATITPEIGSSETGTVTWSDNTGCAQSTVSNGTATCQVTWETTTTQTVTATYSGDSNYASSSGSYNQSISATPPVITSPNSASADQNTAFSFTVTATGDGPFTFALTGGILPPGLSLSTGSGVISGVPTSSHGHFIFTITVTDANQLTAQQNISISIDQALSFFSSNSTSGVVNTAFNYTVDPTGGTSPVTLAVTNIQNPIAGITIPLTGEGSLVLSGTPTASGICTFTVTATDAVGATAVQNFTLTITAPQEVLTIAASPSAGGTVTPDTGGSYNQGSSVPIMATPNAGYTFVGWSSSPDAVANPTSASTTIPMNANETVTAQFSANLVVNTAADDAGDSTQCTAQATPGTNTVDAACSLRDAILFAQNTGAASISFDSTVFASSHTAAANTITLQTALPYLVGQISIAGPGPSVVTVSGGDSTTVGTIFAVSVDSTVSISGISIVHGAGQAGGQTYGGAISSNGTLTITNCALNNNSVTGGASAIFANSGTLTIQDSTFANNIVSGSGYGGVILAYQAAMVVNSSTFSGNVGSTATAGAILDFLDPWPVTVSNSTFVNNTAVYGGGIVNAASGVLTVNNSIFSGNTGVQGAGIDNGGNSLNASNNLYYNNLDSLSGGSGLEDDCNSCTTNTNPVSADPHLAPLGSYGGPTQTFLPLPGSGAICAASSTLIPAGVTTDQRGLPISTTYGSTTCYDIGAVQTNYAIGFVAAPPSTVYTSLPIQPWPAVSVTESSLPATAITGSVTMTDTDSVLSGTTTASLASGTANFSNLLFSSAESSDQLTATLSLNPGLAQPLSVSTQSTQFQVVASVAASLVEPAQGTTFTASTVEFQWSPVTGATNYYLWIGTQGVGSNNLYNSAPKTVTSYSFSNMPLTGVPIYVRLITNFNGVWVHRDYTYSAAGPSSMISPMPGSTLAGTSVTFTWSAAAGSGDNAPSYYLWIGTQGVGSNDLYNSAPKTGTSYTFTKMPLTGQPIYVRLITDIGGKWVSNDYQYTAASVAAITSPTPGTTLGAPSITFTWTPSSGATGYYLWIGTTSGGNDLYNSAEKAPSVTSFTFSKLPTNGQPVYVRLITNLNGVWYHNDYTYTGLSLAALTGPQPGSTFTSASATFTWNPVASATGYYLWIGTQGVGSNDVYNSAEKSASTTSYTFTRLPTNGQTLYVRLITNFNGVWLHNDYQYTAK